MNGYEQILVVVLATFLAIVLLLGIILLVLVVKVIRSVKRITDKAEHLVDTADSIGDVFKHAAAPMAIGRVLGVIADTLFRRKSKRK